MSALEHSRKSEHERARDMFLLHQHRYTDTIPSIKNAKKGGDGAWLPASNNRALGSGAETPMTLEERIQFTRILGHAYDTSWLTGDDNLTAKWQAVSLLLAETVSTAPYRTVEYLRKEHAKLKALCSVSVYHVHTVQYSHWVPWLDECEFLFAEVRQACI
jgi:hypothetical protein